MERFRQLKRAHFFAGQLLAAEDLRQEQEYFLDRLRRRNRFLHGWGIVAGLGVSVEGGSTVVVEPGLAIDCAGNELVVEARQSLPISGAAGRLYVALRYVEIPVDKQPVGQGGTEPSRVLESARVELLAADPGANHRGMGRGTPGCGNAHPLRLATIRRRGSRWRVAAAAGGGRR